MRILVETNILYSVIIRDSNFMAGIVNIIESEFSLVLTNTVIDEFSNRILSKNPESADRWNNFLENTFYEYFHVESLNLDGIKMRDDTDKPILASAYAASCDILITGDKDFKDGDFDIEILTPREFATKFGYIN